ncbi:MAG: tyrosine--tRNA ligase, partial [Bacteroidota bacterium]
MYDLIEMLRARGMIHDITPGTASQLQKETTAGYMGFDPTAASLHVGNLAALLLLRHFQLAGHQPRVLLGGATGMIGDPSGKLAERTLLSQEEVHHNQLGIQKQ